MTHVSLFTGIGGIDLAAEWAGFETIAQVEQNPYSIKVLEKHWPDVYRCEDVRRFPGEWKESVTLVSGGFPCQPFSSSGKRRGSDDDRYLWPEMLRVINELRPSWVLGENVAGLLRMDFSIMLSDLESIGYNTRVFCIPACAINAQHQRKRVFIVANTNGIRCIYKKDKNGYSHLLQEWSPIKFILPGSNEWDELSRNSDSIRGDDGVPDWMDRIKALGNAVVPQQVYPILQAIAEVENE